MLNRSILVVDDDRTLREAVAEALTLEGYEVATAEDGSMAYNYIQKQQPNLILSDLKMPKTDGLQLLNKTKQVFPEIPFVLMSAYGEVDDAVSAMRDGATDFITKPFDLSLLEQMVNKSLSTESPFSSVTERESDLNAIDEIDRILASEDSIPEPEDPKMRRILGLTRQISNHDIAVLITGESGAGKEVLANHIHENSRRANGPFIAINCSAIPENLLESELFGHEKGAFSGAIKAKPGKFELANGGTILLDEIGDMTPELQTKLLRVLQDQKIDRVGSTKPIQVDVRIIASTNKDLKKLIQEGRFREDLYFRLAAFPIHIPALRERMMDLTALTSYFLNKFRFDGTIDQGALRRLHEYEYPGNIRELQNILQRAALICEGKVITANDIIFDAEAYFHRMINEESPEEGENTLRLSSGDQMINFESLDENLIPTIEEVERNLIFSTLEIMKQNRTHTAKKLGISLRTLRNKLRDYREQGFEVKDAI